MLLFQLTPAAKYSLKQIAFYTQEKWENKQRRKYLKTLDECFYDLSNKPSKGKLRTEISEDLFSYRCNKHIIYYIPKENYISIVNVLHECMDPFRHINLDAS